MLAANSAAPLGHGENKIKFWKQSMLKQSDCVIENNDLQT